MYRVAFVIGHHEKAQGAYSEYFGQSEWEFYKEVSKWIEYDIDVFYHDPAIKSYTQRIKNTASKLDNFDLVIEAHFNAATPKANGVETLYYFESEKGKEYAKMFSDIINTQTGIKLRNNGLKALVNKKDRGFASVYYPKPPTILIEPFFGSNMNDSQLIGSHEFLACLIDEFLNEATT